MELEETPGRRNDVRGRPNDRALTSRMSCCALVHQFATLTLLGGLEVLKRDASTSTPATRQRNSILAEGT